MSNHLIGKKFGRLAVAKEDGRDKYGYIMWQCICECGGTIRVNTSRLIHEVTRSCGCLRREITTNKSTTHNLSNHKLYSVWASIKGRCHNPSDKSYQDYGARGIKICDEWNDDFMTFYRWSFSNGYLEGLSIDRKNNDGNYEPQNCRFADRKTQNNNKRSCRVLVFNGQTKNLQQWSDAIGIYRGTLKSRLESGWSLEKSLTAPIQKHNKKMEEI